MFTSEILVQSYVLLFHYNFSQIYRNLIFGCISSPKSVYLTGRRSFTFCKLIQLVVTTYFLMLCFDMSKHAYQTHFTGITRSDQIMNLSLQGIVISSFVYSSSPPAPWRATCLVYLSFTMMIMTQIKPLKEKSKFCLLITSQL